MNSIHLLITGQVFHLFINRTSISFVYKQDQYFICLQTGPVFHLLTTGQVFHLFMNRTSISVAYKQGQYFISFFYLFLKLFFLIFFFFSLSKLSMNMFTIYVSL